MIIFNAGANSRSNKQKVVSYGFNYLTMKPKKVKTYKKHVLQFWKSNPERFGWIELFPSLQLTIKELENPYINGIERLLHS